MNNADKMIAEIESKIFSTQDMIGRAALDKRVISAMRSVPRDNFVPNNLKPFAFDNGPLAIGHGQTISQPYMVALMTDLLHPTANDLMLEIGTGSGYQTAILSCLVKKVFSMERIETLSEAATARLTRHGYSNIETCTGNGYQGWPEYAPYDGIMVTAAATHIPPALVEQLKPGGHLVIPIGLPSLRQELLLVVKDQLGKTRVSSVLGVVFVPLVSD